MRMMNLAKFIMMTLQLRSKLLNFTLGRYFVQSLCDVIYSFPKFINRFTKRTGAQRLFWLCLQTKKYSNYFSKGAVYTLDHPIHKNNWSRVINLVCLISFYYGLLFLLLLEYSMDSIYVQSLWIMKHYSLVFLPNFFWMISAPTFSFFKV